MLMYLVVLIKQLASGWDIGHVQSLCIFLSKTLERTQWNQFRFKMSGFQKQTGSLIVAR